MVTLTTNPHPPSARATPEITDFGAKVDATGPDRAAIVELPAVYLETAATLLAAARNEATRITDEAHAEAAAIVTGARAEHDRLLGRIRPPELVDLLLQDPPQVSGRGVHSSEISAHTFRTTFRGLDAQSVGDWLAVVEASHAVLEDERDHLQQGWDEMLIKAARLRSAFHSMPQAVRDPWHWFALAIAGGRPNIQAAGTDAGFARDALAGAVHGRRRTKSALSAAGAQLARMQHGSAILERSNEQLRTQLIDTLAYGP